MDDFLELKSDVKEIRRDMKTVSDTLIRNTVSLEAHMARTGKNEERIQLVENWLIGVVTTALSGCVAHFILKLL